MLRKLQERIKGAAKQQKSCILPAYTLKLPGISFIDYRTREISRKFAFGMDQTGECKCRSLGLRRLLDLGTTAVLRTVGNIFSINGWRGAFVLNLGRGKEREIASILTTEGMVNLETGLD